MVINMAGCLEEDDVRNINTALDEYRGEVLAMVDDPDPATSELASQILGDIETAKSKIPGLACGL